MAVSRVGWVFEDVVGPPEAPGAVQFFQGGEGPSDDPLCGVDDSLERPPLCGCAARKPHADAVGEDALDQGRFYM